MQAFQLLEEWDKTEEPLTAAQQQELDRRLDRYEQDPTTGTSWETLRSRLLSKAYDLSTHHPPRSRTRH